MTTGASIERPLTQLSREIEQLEADVARFEKERSAIRRRARRITWRLQFLKIAQAIRKPAAQLNLWPLMVLFIGPIVIGVTVLILVHLVTNSYPVAFFAFLLGVVGGVGLFASLMYVPPDGQLPASIHEADSEAQLANARLQEKVERITETRARLTKLLDERRDQIASGKLQKAALLQRKWKTMADAEWEDFVVECCRTLGAKAERTGHAPQDEANLIVDFGSRRVAVLTRAEVHNVTSATIQQVIAAKNRLGCDSCAVIINRRFTGAAQDFAQRHGCTAIGANEFPDFVMNKISL